MYNMFCAGITAAFTIIFVAEGRYVVAVLTLVFTLINLWFGQIEKREAEANIKTPTSRT